MRKYKQRYISSKEQHTSCCRYTIFNRVLEERLPALAWCKSHLSFTQYTLATLSPFFYSVLYYAVYLIYHFFISSTLHLIHLLLLTPSVIPYSQSIISSPCLSCAVSKHLFLLPIYIPGLHTSFYFL